MAFEKCKRCGFMHYSTDPCKESTAAKAEVRANQPNLGGSSMVEQRDASRGGPRPLRAGSTPALPVDTISRSEPRAAPKPKFDRNAYQRDYMRKRRAQQKALD